MGVVTVSSSAARTPLGLNSKFSSNHLALKRPLIVAFKGDKQNETVVVATQEKNPMQVATTKTRKKRLAKPNKQPKIVKAVSTEETFPCSMDVDYNEAAAILENIYKLSPASDTCDEEYIDSKIRRVSRCRKKIGHESNEDLNNDRVVRSQKTKAKRMNLDERIALKKNTDGEDVIPIRKKRNVKNKIEELVREYSVPTDLVSLDWKKMKIPPVLPPSEHALLFKLMQPFKVNS